MSCGESVLFLGGRDKASSGYPADPGAGQLGSMLVKARSAPANLSMENSSVLKVFG